MKSDHAEGGLLSNLELTGNRLLLDRTLRKTDKVFWGNFDSNLLQTFDDYGL